MALPSPYRPTEETMSRFILAPLALASALTLAACGGASESEFSGLSAPLFDNDGAPSAAAAQPPQDPAQTTRAGLYASEAQLEWQQLVSAPSTVLLDLDALESTEAALNLALQVRSFRGVEGLAWFVRGGRGDQAARLADRLADDGVAPVFLVR